MKTLITVDRGVWGKVKDFATVRNVSLNRAVELLLTEALEDQGYPLVILKEREK